MARVFPEDSPMLDPNNVAESFDKVERYLRYMQERIEHMNNSQAKVDERQQEELGLVVTRDGTSIVINDENLATTAQIEYIGGQLSSVVSRVDDSESRITQTANSISSIVQAVGADGTVTAASIVQAINSAGSSVRISADHITLTGDVVMKSNLTDGTTQISGNNISTGTIQAARIDTNNLYLNGQNINGAVANATNAAVANALNNTLSGFANTMLGYVNQAMAIATSSSNAMSIAGIPVYKDTYLGSPTIKMDFGNNYHVRLCPTGITLGSYRYYLIMNTPAGEFGIRTYGTGSGTTISIGYTD